MPSDTPIVNSSTRQSRPTTPPFSPTRGRSAVFTASSARMPTTPSTSPQAPPIADSSTLSVSSCTMMRPRPAPMAERMAISRRRPVARTSSRLATLAQAISRTRPTAPDQHVERGADVGDQLLAQAADVEGLLLVQHLRVFLLVLLGRDLQAGGGLCDRHAGLQLAGDLEVVALIAGVGIELEGDPDVGVGAELADVERLRRRCR